MPRKKKEEVIPQVKEETQEVKKSIAPFSGEFGREDINALRDKVNEIISFINQN